MKRSLDRRLAKLEAQSPTTADDQWTARPSRRVVASRLLLKEALVLMKQADQLLATTGCDGL